MAEIYFCLKNNYNNVEVPDCISDESNNLDLNAVQSYNFSFKVLVFALRAIGMDIYKRV